MHSEQPFAADADKFVHVKDAIQRLDGATSSARGLWDLHGLQMNPAYFSLLIEAFPADPPAGAWKGAITLDLTENRLGEFQEWKASMKRHPTGALRRLYKCFP
jgi:hypothetical protein